VGLVFEGAGVVRAAIPSGIETRSWQVETANAPFEQPFSAAHLRFSDLTLDDLQGERSLVADKDASGSGFRVFDARTKLYDDPSWTRLVPEPVIDVLLDLYGGGSEGGFVLAEFRRSDSAEWLSYYGNPRGALFPDESSAWYRVESRGGAPPRIRVLASFGSVIRASAFDVGTTELDVTFVTQTKMSRSLTDVKVASRLDIVSLGPEPLKAVVLELANRRPLCTAQPDRESIRVSRAVDGQGRPLAVVHRKDRLFIPLAAPLPPGEGVALRLDYDGPMTQGVPGATPDTTFSELGPWAWYPRNPRLDRFASKVTVHLPRFLRAVTTGRLTEEREEKDGWHFTFEEPGGVKTLVLVAGDLVMTPAASRGTKPEVIAWLPRALQKELTNASKTALQLVGGVGGMWGPYPYTALHVVEQPSYPSNNWLAAAGETGAGWSCLPDGLDAPFRNFVEAPSGMLLGPKPIMTPSWDDAELRGLSRLLTEGMSPDAFLRVVALARQWWGHMVPPRSYRDLWIDEGIALWTGVVYARGLGGDVVRERARQLRGLAVEGAKNGRSMLVGERLGRDFTFELWGRAPLLIDSLVAELGTGPFATLLNTLISRAAGPGISTEVLLDTLRQAGGERSAALLSAALQGGFAPAIEWSSTIDKATGEVELVFTQIGEPAPLSLRVDVTYSPTQRESRTARLDGEVTRLVWKLAEVPKKIAVDADGLAPVASVKRVGEEE
jgi:hypothetical protein